MNQKNLFEFIKRKDKGNVRKVDRIKVDLTFMNGDTCSRFFKIPTYLIRYQEPDGSNDYTKKQTFKFWVKLENAQYKRLEKQLNKSLKEISMWLDPVDELKLKRFLEGDEQ